MGILKTFNKAKDSLPEVTVGKFGVNKSYLFCNLKRYPIKGVKVSLEILDDGGKRMSATRIAGGTVGMGILTGGIGLAVGPILDGMSKKKKKAKYYISCITADKKLLEETIETKDPENIHKFVTRVELYSQD